MAQLSYLIYAVPISFASCSAFAFTSSIVPAYEKQIINGLFSKRDHETYHIERGLREVIVLALDDLLEGTDGILQWDELALITSEDLGDLERLRHETLDLTSTLDLLCHVSNISETGKKFNLRSTCPLPTTRTYPR